MPDIQPQVTQGNNILLSDYNNIQTKIANILGAGSGQSGYGQSLASSQLAANSVIDDAHWDNLRTDLLKARQYQTGVNQAANLTDVAAGETIDDVVITGYETFATTVETNKFSVGAGQRGTTAEVSTVKPAGWNGTATATITYDFGSAAAARYFFNSSGELYVRAFIPQDVNSVLGEKNDVWGLLLSDVFPAYFRAFDWSDGLFGSTIGFYDLTNSYQQIIKRQPTAGGVYSENVLLVEAACDVASNTTGGARYVYIRLQFQDNDVGDKTGTGAAVDENVNAVTVSSYSVYANTTNVTVATPSISIPAF